MEDWSRTTRLKQWKTLKSVLIHICLWLALAAIAYGSVEKDNTLACVIFLIGMLVFTPVIFPFVLVVIGLIWVGILFLMQRFETIGRINFRAHAPIFIFGAVGCLYIAARSAGRCTL